MQTTTIDRATSALQAIPADCPRDDWVKTLTAAKAAGIDQDDAQAWSATASNYDASDFADVWRSIKATGGVTEASLFYVARQYGWKDDTPAPSPQALAQQQADRALKQAQEQASREQEARQAAQWADKLWRDSKPAPADHAYLVRKGIAPVPTLRSMDASLVADVLGYRPQAAGQGLDGALLIAVGRRVADGLCTAELIDTHGHKAALRGAGTRSGAFWATGKIDGAATLLLCEGVATALSASQCTGHVAVATFSNANMPAVAKALRQQYPDATLVLCADVDKATGEPDSHAVQAAQAVGGLLSVPAFTDRQPGQKDINDLHKSEGQDAVKACIARAKKVEDAEPAEQWPEPEALPEALPPVQKFDLDLLPDALRDWIADIAHRMQQPPDYAAVSAMVALSSLIGARTVIKPKQRDDWEVVPNMWGLIVGRPGMLKSPAIVQTHKPLKAYEAEERKAHAAALADWEADCEVAKLQAENNKKQAAKVANSDPGQARRLLEPVQLPPAPVMRRYAVNDTTVEKLGELLAQNEWGLLVYRDELYGLLTSLDKQGQEGSRAFYLQAYDGNQGYTFDRIMRGETYIPRVCLSLFGGIQPSRLHDYVRNAVTGGAGDDGLLQRFGMAVWPDAQQEFTMLDQWPDTPARQQAREAFDRLQRLQPAKGEGMEANEEPAVWQFDDAAQQAFYQWFTALELELRSGELHPAMESHLSKYRKLIPALALILQLVDDPEGGKVGIVSFTRAVAWGQYLRSHAERIYSAASTPDTSAAHVLLHNIKEGKVTDGFTPREVAQKHWAWLDTTDAVKGAAAMLCDYGWLRQIVKPTTHKGGRPSESYVIHPSLQPKGAA